MRMLRSEAEKLEITLACEAQSRYVSWVQKEESVDYETAWRWCTDPDAGHPEHRLGFKMSDPLAQLAMNMQIGKKARSNATANFKDTLDAEELEIFEAEVEPMDTRAKFKAAMRRAEKGKKAEP